MPVLFGKNLSRQELQHFMADPAQVAGVQRATLREGRADGVDTILFRTGTGFEFTVTPSRALDISRASYNGIPLYWHATPGSVHPAFFEPAGMGWMRGYAGGLLTTGGLSAMGSPSVDAGEELGIHGRISYSPAHHVCTDAGWEGDRYLLEARGTMAETTALGPNLVLRRRIVSEMGASWLRIHDTVENRTHQPAPHMMLYHFNIGYPILSPDARLLVNADEVVGRDAISQAAIATRERFLPPAPDRPHQLYYYRPKPDSDGKAHIALIGRVDDQPFGVYLSYTQAVLPWFANWKCMTAGDYVTGLEPANAWVEGRAVERAEGRLRTLNAWETVHYDVEFGVLAGAEAVEAFTARHALDARMPESQQ